MGISYVYAKSSLVHREDIDGTSYPTLVLASVGVDYTGSSLGSDHSSTQVFSFRIQIICNASPYILY